MKASTNKPTTQWQVLLATAIVNVRTKSGTFLPANFAQQLGLQRQRIDTPINGIGNCETKAEYMASVTLSSKATPFSTDLQAVILKRISDYQPNCSFNISAWNLPHKIQLADPQFYKTNKIDMLLGADLCYELFEDGKITLSEDLPILQNTKLGWIVAGRTKTMATLPMLQCHIATRSSPPITALEKQVKRFWETEHYEAPTKQMTEEEFMCEQHFSKTVTRTKNGSFMVRLPFKEDPSMLGSSRQLAFKRLQMMEKKLSKNQLLKTQYDEFLQEYQALDHMEYIKTPSVPSGTYFLPHHAVERPESTTTKLRVVFDGSAKTTSGKSLNQILMVGPTVQSDLFSIILRFRIHQVVFTADIAKMYRQILIAPEDRKYQSILWKPPKLQVAQAFQLKTVTYGTSAAPFLATRCLKELSEIEKANWPRAANVLNRDMYVDDCLSGADSNEEAKKLICELSLLLKLGNFELRKFCSNNLSILSNVPEEYREKTFIFQQNEAVKTLGLIWLPQEDVFQFNFLVTTHEKLTKRTILSDLAKLFDPMGLLGPSIVLGKLFLQDLWKLQIDWDSAIPHELESRWKTLINQFVDLKLCSIPRCVLLPAPTLIELHAFSDSSEVAYGACCYLRSINSFGQVNVSLLCSKSRIAPLKFTTIAKLELCGASLMAELVERLLQTLTINIENVFYYTDSSTVLSWLKSPSYTWNTYVANRVGRIQELTRIQQWKHISSVHNPADMLSRGAFIKNLINSSVWFDGPEFLRCSTITIPSRFEQVSAEEIPERRPVRVALAATTENPQLLSLIDTFNHKNSFVFTQRIIAYIFRFFNNCHLPRNSRTKGQLTTVELETGLIGLIKNVQRTSFGKQYEKLSSNTPLDNNDQLSSLTLFIEKNTDVIRVGGRLLHSNLPTATKHQILLPKGHTFTKLLLEHLHRKHLHVAQQGLVAISRERFWIIDVKRMATSVVHKCIRCFKTKPRQIHQLMGQLPEDRVTPSRPFSTVGIDYCGPILIHHKIRGIKLTKAYIAVFVCFSTKAVHLELVSDLSTLTFINALKRFIGRRGICKKIYSDNATNFVGAKSELIELKQLHQSTQFQQDVTRFCQLENIKWKNIPPRAPHFGGIWEAAVKSAKHHLIRYIATASLTSEELQTVIVQIEAILNSRPLTPLSSNPNDLGALTPGHFLIGAPLTCLPEQTLDDTNMNRLTKFRQIQSIHQQFWKRWSCEYLNLLQSKSKWKKEQLQEGELVLIKDLNLPPLKWKTARVVSAIKGKDNLIRVTSIKTETGLLTRAIHQLCPFPKEEKSKPTKCNLLSTALLTLLICCSTISETSAERVSPNANLTELDNNMGIYFENIGHVKTVSSGWNVIIFYNLSTYWQELEGLKKYSADMHLRCHAEKLSETYCTTFIQEIDHRISVIEHNNQLLHNFNDQNHLRAKRSPFDIIGTISNSLFGILDQNYAKELEKEIQRVHFNEKHLLNLIKNQTSIADSTLNIFKKTTFEINKQFKLLSGDLISMANEIKKESTQSHSNSLLNYLFSYVILIITNYENTQKNILDVVLDMHHQRVNPQLITPDQLQSQISTIRNNIPPNLLLPAKELLNIYKLISVKTQITETQ